MLNYELHNNNKEENIVFIHGFGGSTKTWKRQIQFFSEKFNVLLIDLPGHGNSVKEKAITPEYVSRKIKEVLDFLNIKKAQFVGLSLGSLVVAHFAIENPEYVKSIIFGGAAIKVDGIYKFLVHLINIIKGILPHYFLFKLFASIMLPKKNHEKSRNIFIREGKKMNRKDFISWVDYISETAHANKLLNDLKKLDIKMIFISGDEDGCFLNGTRKAAREVGAKLNLIHHCGHVCTIEKAEEFNQMAFKFLKATAY